jgi:hypothetical protein
VTSAEWNRCTDASLMLAFLQGKVSDRKLRLFGVACCRQEWSLFFDQRSKHGVDVSERYADGLATEEELRSAEGEAWAARDLIWERSVEEGTYEHTGWMAGEAASDAAWAAQVEYDVSRLMNDLSDRHWRRRCAVLLRDLVNPFRSIQLFDAWLTPEVVTLARHIYHDRDFERMQELAAALEEAGCHDRGLLGHCRSLAAHVRGCWVVDLLLGKE